MKHTDLLTRFEQFVGLEVEAHITGYKYTSVGLINKLHDKNTKKKETNLII
jgi:hypothetical protein